VEWGPVFHRGRLDGTARVLVIGQDPAAHEAVARRIPVTAFHTWRDAPGSAPSSGAYQHMLHPTFPDSAIASGADPVQSWTRLIDDWNAALTALDGAVTPDTPRPLVRYDPAVAATGKLPPADLGTIPEADLPAGLPSWLRLLSRPRPYDRSTTPAPCPYTSAIDPRPEEGVMTDPAQHPERPAPNYPGTLVPAGHVEPVPRRIRGFAGGRPVLDTRRARYVWEWPPYPQFSIPVADVTGGELVDEGHEEKRAPGTARRHALRVGEELRPGAAWVWADDASEGLAGTVRFEWAALDAWFEEDEQVFVHPRSPYARVDALRSSSHVRVGLDGLTLADAPSCVPVFETGLPTRYYLDRVYVDFTLLTPSDTVTACPYKGTTSGYWSVRTPHGTQRDLAWAYDFPTRQLAPIAGLVCFYNERVDLYVDGELLPRPERR
jgi:uncharacterized protein (DUF427 family)